MPTDHKRMKIAFEDPTLEKLNWLIAEEQKKSKTKVYPCHVVKKLIDNAYTVQSVFGKQQR